MHGLFKIDLTFCNARKVIKIAAELAIMAEWAQAAARGSAKANCCGREGSRDRESDW
jgi:hypothetical protein